MRRLRKKSHIHGYGFTDVHQIQFFAYSLYIVFPLCTTLFCGFRQGKDGIFFKNMAALGEQPETLIPSFRSGQERSPCLNTNTRLHIQTGADQPSSSSTRCIAAAQSPRA
ncbi:hypothetical protein [Paenibacillus sp. 7541]|uniref:hypothetical protein n=1 Tax=Paenibacillus sp. 7541 TaxID=2026236 RepID=UPI001595A905|nr:hypothetical protein [Paenibacillus sp. 7541]